MGNDVIKIALCGKLRSGKDTVATHLSVRQNFATPIAFGHALKDVAHRAFIDVPREPKPRALYQFMNVMREFDPQVWIKHVERRVAYELEKRSTQGIVITDARQSNEVAWARANGFTIVRVTTPDDIRIARAESVGDAFSYEDLTHPTELEVDGFSVDYELINDGNYAELCAKVDELVTEIKRKGAI